MMAYGVTWAPSRRRRRRRWRSRASSSRRAQQAAASEEKGRAPWSDEEDATLIEGVRRHGYQWRVIVASLPGRSGSMARNRYKRLLDEAEVEEVDNVQVGQGYDLTNEANVAAREALEKARPAASAAPAPAMAAAASSSSSAGSSELEGMQVEDLDD